MPSRPEKSVTGSMATYQIMTRDPATGKTMARESNNYRRSVLAARYDHERRGLNVTIIRRDSGNVVIWMGANMASEMRKQKDRSDGTAR